MRKINYKSDFDFIMRLKDCSDPEKTVPFPDGDFDARFWTSSKADAYTASCRNGVYTNCFRTEDGGMHFVFNNQYLGIGPLKWESHFELPNDIYPDGMQDIFRNAKLDIELVDGDGDCPTQSEIEYILPYIKGEAFTYADFTAEQIEGLQRPATEAAGRLDRFVKTATEAETARETAETARVRAEEIRISSEETRASAESIRLAAEERRVSAENTRVSAETVRGKAEQERAAAFSGWKNEIDGMPDKAEFNAFANRWLRLRAIFGPVLFGVDRINRTFSVSWQNTDGASARYFVSDLSLDEARLIAELIVPPVLGYAELSCAGRVSLPPMSYHQGSGPKFYAADTNILQYNSTIEVCLLAPLSSGYFYVDNQPITITSCKSLKAIIGEARGMFPAANPMKFVAGSNGFPALEYFRMQLVASLDLRTSPLITLDTFEFLIGHAANTSPITITVHPDVYAKITDETNTEWYALLDAAAAKDISFATV